MYINRLQNIIVDLKGYYALAIVISPQHMSCGALADAVRRPTRTLPLVSGAPAPGPQISRVPDTHGDLMPEPTRH